MLTTSPNYPDDIISRESFLRNFGGADRILLVLSLLGDRSVEMDGRLLTKSVGRLPIHITPSFWRHFHCSESCKAVCCISTKAHIVYLPNETAFSNVPEEVRSRFSQTVINVNGVPVTIYQSSKSTMGTKPDLNRPISRYCQFLSVFPDGRWGCTLQQYGKENKPLICHMGMEWSISEVENRLVRIHQRLLGRSWLYDPPMMCEYTDTGIPDLDDKIKAFRRLREWAEICGVFSALERIEKCISLFESVRESGKSPKETIIIP